MSSFTDSSSTPHGGTLTDAKRLCQIYSLFGLTEGIKDLRTKIAQHEHDKSEVLAGRKWNPLMKDGIVRELDASIASCNADILVYEEAVRLKNAKS